MASPTTLAQLAASISKGEGYGASPTNRPTRLSNPGDLTGTGYAGEIGTDPQGFAIFSSPTAGQAALQQYLSQHLGQVGTGAGAYGALTPSSTLQDFLNIYAGNPDTGYVSTVAQGIGVSPSTPLSQIQALLAAQGAITPPSASTTPLNAIPAPQSPLLNDVGAGYADLTGLVDESASGVGVSPGVLLGGIVALAALYLALS